MLIMKSSDFTIHNTKKLDMILSNCCSLILKKQKDNPKYWGMVGSCVIDADNNMVYGVNHFMEDGKRLHAERVATNNYIEKYGKIPEGSIIVTTLSPCSEPMDERYGVSCTELVNSLGIHKVYCGYEDPTQVDDTVYQHKKFHVMETRNKKLRELCKKFSDTFLNK